MPLIDSLSGIVTGQRGGKALPQEVTLPEGFVTNTVTAQDRIPERIRASQAGYVHVSSLTAFCGRQLVLMRREERPLLRSVTGGHRVMWRVGRAVEAHIREQFIKGRHFHGILGRWTCRCGKMSMPGLYRSTAVCNSCNGAVDVYGEYTLLDPESHLVGNPDLLIEHEGAVVVVEIKSMARERWEALQAPLADHVLQAGMYHDLLPKHGMRPHKSLVFVYCTKEFKYGSPYKEFHVDATTGMLLNQRAGLRAQVRDAMAHEMAGTLPARTVCRNTSAQMAKECAVCAACFNTGEG